MVINKLVLFEKKIPLTILIFFHLFLTLSETITASIFRCTILPKGFRMLTYDNMHFLLIGCRIPHLLIVVIAGLS